MKKINTRSILLMVIVLTSVFSYIYLNTITLPTTTNVADSKEVVKEQVESKEKEIVLPDVQLLKRIVQTGKRFLPAAS